MSSKSSVMISVVKVLFANDVSMWSQCLFDELPDRSCDITSYAQAKDWLLRMPMGQWMKSELKLSRLDDSSERDGQGCHGTADEAVVCG